MSTVKKQSYSYFNRHTNRIITRSAYYKLPASRRKDYERMRTPQPAPEVPMVNRLTGEQITRKEWLKLTARMQHKYSPLGSFDDARKPVPSLENVDIKVTLPTGESTSWLWDSTKGDSSPADRDPGEVAVVLHTLVGEVEALRAAVTTLSKRLEPVVLPFEHERPADRSADYKTPLAVALAKLTADVVGVGSFLNALASKVQV